MRTARKTAAALAAGAIVLGAAAFDVAAADPADAAACRIWVYDVAHSPHPGGYITIWDSWSFDSDPVGRLLIGDRVYSNSVGNNFVRTDRVRMETANAGTVFSIAYRNDYVAKSGLDYITCWA